MEQTIGTCSLCGGPVRIPTVFWSVIPPVPTCASCGATKSSHGPVIDMSPAPRHWAGNAGRIVITPNTEPKK